MKNCEHKNVEGKMKQFILAVCCVLILNPVLSFAESNYIQRRNYVWSGMSSQDTFKDTEIFIQEETEIKEKENNGQSREWTKTQKVLLGTYLLANTIDYFQTREILSNDRFYEKNPFITDNESCNMVFLATTVITATTAHFFPKYRTAILTVASLFELNLVRHNYSLGVRIEF
jgi:hypothetical protein